MPGFLGRGSAPPASDKLSCHQSVRTGRFPQNADYTSMNYTTSHDIRTASKVLELAQAEFPALLLTYVKAHHGNDCHLFEFTLSGQSVREELSTELITDDDRTSNLLNRIRRAARRIGHITVR